MEITARVKMINDRIKQNNLQFELAKQKRSELTSLLSSMGLHSIEEAEERLVRARAELGILDARIEEAIVSLEEQLT
jgi:uncharacterized membrane protein